MAGLGEESAEEKYDCTNLCGYLPGLVILQFYTGFLKCGPGGQGSHIRDYIPGGFRVSRGPE